MRYVVTYDIRDPKRLYRVFRTLRKYGDHLQLSVFECCMEEKALVRLKDALRKIVRAEEDQVLFIRIGTDTAADRDSVITAIGLPYAVRDRTVTVL